MPYFVVDGAAEAIDFYEPPKCHAPSVGLYLYVDDVDAVFQRALDAGATAQSHRGLHGGARQGDDAADGVDGPYGATVVYEPR
jgi:hypothetical protein